MKNSKLIKLNKYTVLKIIAIYASFSSLWIYFSDTALGLIVSDTTTFTSISVYKGFLFVIITSILLYQLVSRYLLEASQLKEEIKSKNQLFYLLSESMIDAYVSVDMTGKILQFNEVFRTMLGYETEELLSKTYNDVTPEKWHSVERKIILEQVIQIGYSQLYEKEYRKKDGIVFPVELRVQLIRDDMGNPSAMWAIVHDITERKQVQDKLAYKSLQLMKLNKSLERRVEEGILQISQRDHVLRQQNRVAIMGDMIGHIAHQWRQPLNSLGLQIQLLPSEYKLGNLSEEYIDKIVHDSMLIIDHMSETIDDFSCFFKPDKKMISFNIKHSVARAIQLVKASCDYNNIKIIMNCVDEAVIQGHPNEYSQVVLNILSNAKDALLTNKTEYPQIIITTRVKDGRSVVTISDNAGGIPDKIIDKVFNPFFTTKGEHGSGIGLFMSKYIIERNMKGILSAVNKDEGAEFIIEV